MPLVWIRKQVSQPLVDYPIGPPAAAHPHHQPRVAHILLTAEGSRRYLATAESVIVDEIHAVASDAPDPAEVEAEGRRAVPGAAQRDGANREGGAEVDPKIALLLEMERSVWSQIWQNLTGLTEEEYRWRPLPQANDINWILRHLAGYERYCGNIVRGLDVGREHWPDAPFLQIKKDLEELAAEYQQAIAPLRWDDLTYQVAYGPGRTRRLDDLLTYHPLHTSGHRFQIRYIRGTHARLTGKDKRVFDPG